MKHIFASSSLKVTGNPENQPTQQELLLPDGKAISELINEEDKNQRKDDIEQSNRETLS